MRRFLILAIACVVLPVCAQEAAGPHWAMSFFYDEDESSLAIHAISFADSAHGVALGELNEKGDRKPAAVITADGGANWKLVKLKKLGTSLFFLDVHNGWMVAEDGIWKTSDAGETFERISKRKDVERVYFLDAGHGFASGTEGRVWETNDGGAEWNELEVTKQIKADRDTSTFSAIDFHGQRGIILGWNIPASRARMRGRGTSRLLPSLTLSLQTLDGGKTWTQSTSSLFGRIIEYKLEGQGNAYALISFGGNFEYPSEFYKIGINQNRASRVFRQRDRAVTDFTVLENGAVWLAAVEPPGTSVRVPIPGKVKMLYSPNGAGFSETPVDYRAVAGNVVVTGAPGGGVWAGTDTGMILELKQN